MNTVTFDEQPAYTSADRTPRGMMGWLIRKGLARTEGQAAFLLTIVGFACLVTAVFIFVQTVSEKPVDPSKRFVPVYDSVY